MTSPWRLELEVGVDPLVDRDEAQLLEPPDLRLREGLETRTRREPIRATSRARGRAAYGAQRPEAAARPSAHARNAAHRPARGRCAGRSRAHVSRVRPSPAPCGAARPRSAVTPWPSSARSRPRADRQVDPSQRPGRAREREPPATRAGADRRARSCPVSSETSSGPSIRRSSVTGDLRPSNVLVSSTHTRDPRALKTRSRAPLASVGGPLPAGWRPLRPCRP